MKEGVKSGYETDSPKFASPLAFRGGLTSKGENRPRNVGGLGSHHKERGPLRTHKKGPRLESITWQTAKSPEGQILLQSSGPRGAEALQLFDMGK